VPTSQNEREAQKQAALFISISLVVLVHCTCAALLTLEKYGNGSGSLALGCLGRPFAATVIVVIHSHLSLWHIVGRGANTAAASHATTFRANGAGKVELGDGFRTSCSHVDKDDQVKFVDVGPVLMDNNREVFCERVL
jgi:hypothetical protein